jgi:hypothetical protein
MNQRALAIPFLVFDGSHAGIFKKAHFPHNFVVWLHTEVMNHPVEMDGVANGRLLIISWASIHVIKLTGIHVALQCLLSGGWAATLSDSPER